MGLMKRVDNVERFLAMSKEKVDIVWEAGLAQGYDTKHFCTSLGWLLDDDHMNSLNHIFSNEHYTF